MPQQLTGVTDAMGVDWQEDNVRQQQDDVYGDGVAIERWGLEIKESSDNLWRAIGLGFCVRRVLATNKQSSNKYQPLIFFEAIIDAARCYSN